MTNEYEARHCDPAHDLAVLGGLTRALRGNADQLERIADDSDTEGHAHLFSGLAAERRAAADRLEAVLIQNGGRAGDGGSILAKAQRAVMDMRHALMGDEADRVDMADDGEAGLERRLRMAAADETLSPPVLEIVRRVHSDLGMEAGGLHDLRLSMDSRRDVDAGIFPR